MAFKGIVSKGIKLSALIRRLVTTTNVPSSPCCLESLDSRALLRIGGNEVDAYLQGLITNDIKHLSEDSSCMYAMFLNSRGRVLYDTIIYKVRDKNTFLIECDKSVSDSLKKHLLMYRVKRKINVDVMDNDLDVWVLYKKNALQTNNNECFSQDENITVEETLDNCMVYSDPRIGSLGLRIIAPKKRNITEKLKENSNLELFPEKYYKSLRYKLGVGEGVGELPPGECFPLEANCDYLHGISFHKGCYIGQELTARTYHTGVIRKRVMPIVLDETINFSSESIPVLLGNGTEKSIGKLRGIEGTLGIGLLRIEEALKASAFKILGVTSRTCRPFWWPSEMSKQNLKENKHRTGSTIPL